MGAYYLNSVFLSNKPTGLGIYTRELLGRMSEFSNNNSFDVLLSQSVKDSVPYVQRPVYIRDNTAQNPIKRIMYYKRLKCDFFYSFTHHGPVKKNMNQIITIHDLIPLYFPNQYKSQYYYYKYYLPKIIKSSDMIVTISENTKQDIMKFYKTKEEKIKVIYNGYEHLVAAPDTQTHVNKNERPYMLMVGATYPHKNLRIVLEAYAKIHHKIELDCIIVGRESEYFNELRSFIDSQGLTNRVKLLGYVSDKELKTLYANANMFVYPSLYEGFGLPVLEAMLSDVPTIVSNTSSIPEVAGNASVIVDPGKVNEIAESILAVYDNSQLREQLISNGRENLKRFSWNQASDEIIKLISHYV